MAKRSGNGKPVDPQIKLLTSIDEKLAQLVEGQERLTEGQERLTESVSTLTKRVDNMLEFLGKHWSVHDQRLAAVEQRLTKAGL